MIGTDKFVTDEERDSFLFIISAYNTINELMNQADFADFNDTQVREYITGIAQAWIENKYNEYIWRNSIKNKYNVEGKITLDGNNIIILEDGDR